MTILHLTQHPATPAQREAGVVDLEGEERAELIRLLTFEELPGCREIVSRAMALAALAHRHGATHAMLGGALYLMGPLEVALRFAQVVPLYAFSVRESTEERLADGTVKKTQVFRHLGFVHGAVSSR